MNTYIVELHTGVWLAETAGDPGRTLVKRNAQVFNAASDARHALDKARNYRPFLYARILPKR